MSGFAFILADLMTALGRDAYHAQVTELFFIIFVTAPIVAGAPLLLAQWNRYKREDNARRRAAQRRRMERTVR